MNTYEIEALVRAADNLRNYEKDSKGDKVHEKILDLVAAELGRVDSDNEVASLQVSNSNKQANLNLLAGKSMELLGALKNSVITSHPVSLDKAIEELETLAKSLIQEDPTASSC